MTMFIMVPLFAILNRARGTQLFGYVHSTVIGRLTAMGFMALIASMIPIPDLQKMLEVFAWTWASLMLWCTPAWDKYWSAAIGHDPAHSRLWGLATMTIRMTLAAPCIIVLAFITDHPERAWIAAGTLLMGLPYYIAGYAYPKNPVAVAEYSVGAILGTLVYLTTNPAF